MLGLPACARAAQSGPDARRTPAERTSAYFLYARVSDRASDAADGPLCAVRPALGLQSRRWQWRGVQGRVYVLVKEPRAGFVKTRLCPPLSERDACNLAMAFAEDTLSRLAALRDEAHVDVRVALDSGAAGSDSRIRVLARSLALAVEEQGDGDLGTRMARLVERGVAEGSPAILVGTDSPDLPLETLAAATRALTRVDVVLAPAEDGGYVLVGARRPVRALFEIEVPWSGPHVFEATCRALRRAQCSFETLPAWDDVDDAASLARLARRLDEGDGASAPATACVLAEWKREGVRF
jgi:uncharacterized protein